MTAAAIDLSLEALIAESGGDFSIQGAPISDTDFPTDLEYNVIVVSASNIHLPALIHGFIYLPSLADDDPCIALNAPYVPSNVTLISDIPDHNSQTLVALVPWLQNGNCPTHYIDAAQADNAKAMIVFPATNSTAAPPGASSQFWQLDGDSDSWKDDVGFPVLAIDGHTGNSLMQASQRYNRNITDVPHSFDLLSHFNSSSSVRLYTSIDMASAGGISPELWVFLLLVLGIMLVLMGVTSFVMHWLQSRRRRDLRRRVENGEVDLEALGIKRLTVPKEVLDKMPVYTFGTGEPALPETQKATTSEDEMAKSTASTTVSPAGATGSGPSLKTWLGTSAPPINRRLSRSTSHPHHPQYVPSISRSKSFKTAQQVTRLDQPTCAICLEDFLSPTTTSDAADPSKVTQQAGSTVRQLPCTHIFHPACIDSFLLTTSSLCPMCKASALPTGYCPRVLTNAMVRRERILRRRGPIAAAVDAAPLNPTQRSRVIGWGTAMVDRSAVPRTGGLRPITLRITSSLSRGPDSRAGEAVEEDGTAAPAPTAAADVADEEREVGVAAGEASAHGTSDPDVVNQQAERADEISAPRTETPSDRSTDPDTIATDTTKQPHPPADTIMSPISPPASAPLPAVASRSTARHREWARQRAAAMLGYSAPADPDAEEERTMPGWRKALLKVWPALGR